MKGINLLFAFVLLGNLAFGQRSNSYLENSHKFGLLATSDFNASYRAGLGVSYSKYKNAFHYMGDFRYGSFANAQEEYQTFSVSYGIGVQAFTIGNSINANVTLSPFVGYERKESLISVGKKLEFIKAGGLLRGEIEINLFNLNTLSLGGEQEFGYYDKVNDYIFRRNLYIALRFSI